MTIAERIRQEREKRGWSQEQLAEMIGVDRTTINKYETGASRPTRKIKELSALLGISANEFVGVKVSLHADTSRAVGQPVAMIPVYGRIVAGEPREAVKEILGYTAIPDKNARAEDFFALKVFGASMQPTFLDGDTVIIRKQTTVDNGQVAVVLIENEDATVKRVFIAPDGITISADNPAVFRQRFYTNEEIELLPVRILGHVVGFFRDV